ncbi:chloride channel, nucleotide-sensitive, 1A [Coccidioides immitis RS]|uniref:Chloride channel, nucleotide-sensitive, 1A n=2 Tax=Coccidioides immitis TaxID=5501 RepID=A0A0E1RWW1_COCIM|nr:chloride channel, nucleotide-sensitive, 1A [Coccidioides immitis RS]EAS31186.1 chloride channel, nucleotide-sensitive, 1A [Coccidioides immitis RS]KMU74775.1 hypothetical protein CISG_00705 [Coccidioides immitis RMSCC 3703]
MEVLHDAPNPASFVTLAEHQSHTPESFYSGPPILHHLSERCKVVILDGDLTSTPALSGLRPSTAGPDATNGAPTVEASGDQEKEVVIDGVDVWVTSEKLLLYNAAATTGVAIPYPTISLHAIQRLKLPNSQETTDVQGLYMQLSTGGDAEDMEEDVEEEPVSLTIVPQTASTRAEGEGEDEALLTDDKPSQTPTELLFAALSTCSNLHPDPAAGEEEGEDEQQLGNSVLFQNGLIMPGNSAGGLPPAMPGSGGWITAENMHEYFDEEGNWIGDDQGPLGPGAGSTRPREDDEGGQNGSGAETEETKWRRTG